MAKSRAKSSNDFEIKSTEDVFLDFATPKIESLFDSIYKTFENKQSSKITKSVLLPINNFFEKFAKKEAQNPVTPNLNNNQGIASCRARSLRLWIL